MALVLFGPLGTTILLVVLIACLAGRAVHRQYQLFTAARRERPAQLGGGGSHLSKRRR